MKASEFRTLLEGKGWRPAAHPKEIEADGHDGLKHYQLKVHKVGDKDVDVKTIAYWLDTKGVLGEAGAVYIDRNNRNALEIMEPVASDSVLDEAIAVVKALPGVVGAQARRDIDDVIIVTAIVIEGGDAVRKQYVVSGGVACPYAPPQEG